jgi:hypothetical protein
MTKNDPGKKAWLLPKDSINENEVAREKRHIEVTPEKV